MKTTNHKLLWAVFGGYISILLRITVFRSDFGYHALFQNGKIIWIPFESGILNTAFPFSSIFLWEI